MYLINGQLSIYNLKAWRAWTSDACSATWSHFWELAVGFATPLLLHIQVLPPFLYFFLAHGRRHWNDTCNGDGSKGLCRVKTPVSWDTESFPGTWQMFSWGAKGQPAHCHLPHVLDCNSLRCFRAFSCLTNGNWRLSLWLLRWFAYYFTAPVFMVGT